MEDTRGLKDVLARPSLTMLRGAGGLVVLKQRKQGAMRAMEDADAPEECGDFGSKSPTGSLQRGPSLTSLEVDAPKPQS